MIRNNTTISLQQPKGSWLTPELIERGRLLFSKKFGRPVTTKEAEAMAYNLANLVQHSFEFYKRNATK